MLRVEQVLNEFVNWLESYGETSWDHQSFFAGRVGGAAKALYYSHKKLGTAAVAPMVFFEAFLPSARRLFHHSIRFPIADAHYAMGFTLLYEATGERKCFERAIHFLEVLKATRSPGFEEYCWGYPFDWVWRGGTITKQTPLITTTPYCYEAFFQVAELLDLEGEQRTDDRFQTTEDQGWRAASGCVEPKVWSEARRDNLLTQVQADSRVDRASCAHDIKDFRTSEKRQQLFLYPFRQRRSDQRRGISRLSADQCFSSYSRTTITGRLLNVI